MASTTTTARKSESCASVFGMSEMQGESEGRAKGDRLIWVDFLRGIAIMLMIPANLSPYYAEPHAMWYRFMSSLAAPMFICLSAGMVVLYSEKHRFGYYVTRGGAVILIGVLLDVLLWRILPFASVDVLYVIGLSTPLVYLVRKQRVGALIAAGGILMLGGPLLQTFVGYNAKFWKSNSAVPTCRRYRGLLQVGLRTDTSHCVLGWAILSWGLPCSSVFRKLKRKAT